MRRLLRAMSVATAVAMLLPMAGCRGKAADPRTVVMIIESSPNNLDLRQGTDAQSERVGGVIFDGLVTKDEHYKLKPWLATAWEQTDPLTLVIHLRDGVQFQDGRPMEAEDVAWTIRSMVDGTLITAKGGAFASVDRVDVRDRLTLVVHLKHPDAGLLFNMSNGLFGVVPRGAGRDFGLHPVGTGPFAFVSAVQDKEVIVRRNEHYWAGAPKIDGVRFTVVPDAITSALELRKGAADLASNVVTLDMIHTLKQAPNLGVASGESSVVVYTNFNVNDATLKDRRVRQAIACAIDRKAIIDAIWRGEAKPAETLLPAGHWAAADDASMAQYPHDVERAERLLEEAGYRRGADGVRLTITMKTSTDETTRLMAMVMQQQLRAAGIRLELRSAEFGTFYADVTRGAFQMYALRWIGSNEDPDIFRYTYGSAAFPPKGANRGRYSNPRVDALLTAAAAETDEAKRRQDYVEVQKILAVDLPGIPLWYPNNEVVYSRRIAGVQPEASGTFSYLRTITIQ
ncbi:MAG: ABC transporter substrate-binding protein [Edaphobacter sp.]|uniref:ABC transporter substrate-binding protein n=1 Tax=Edaphobacter sp. TaxID=1934404 RepID=UPI002385028B|nr:ABC transporter substrate-binding protein [Edaphobacter sp.]MDE1177420.1 ABC transporter substrate-binding protein [Edaphobacter sp.]